MRKSMFHLVCLSLLLPLVFFGCSGSDGAAGAPGASAAPVDPAAAATPETCSVCHSGVGDAHQLVYDAYADTSTLNASIVSVTSVDNGTAGFYNVTMVFDVTQNGLPYIDTGKSSNGNGFPTLNQKTFYAVAYDSATRRFIKSKSFDQKTITHIANGRYSITVKGTEFAPENDNAAVYLYVAKGPIAGLGSHYSLYSDVFNVGQEFGDVDTYQSAAVVSGCEKCHGSPYMKHGYRAAEVAGLPDFAACKTCHYDTRNGGHQSWQLLVDNPARYAELHELAKAYAAIDCTALNSVEKNMTTAEKTQYAYIANVMNDVHMSHAMEFPYPQSMANCVTCHEGKLDLILTDANFTVATCKSCHPVTGGTDTARNTDSDPELEFQVDTRGRALRTIMPPAIHGNGTWDLNTVQCNLCHVAGTGFKVFRDIHSGYDKKTYTAAGQKYSAAFTVTIDNASFANDVLAFGFHAAESPDIAGLAATDIKPTVLVGLYGYDTKDYIAGPHERTFDDNGDGVVNSSDKRDLEYAVGTVHPRFTTVSAAGGSWNVTADLSSWADKIAGGTVKRVEIAVMPALKNADGVTLALNAPSRTFDLGANAFNDAFYKPIVKIADGCNTCHDALATTFHSADRGGNIVVCRLCHITKSGGSHLEMQSRSIDSYAHAIHSFQAFDIGDIDFTDPVEATMYDLHIEHVYPNFTIKNCKSCHNAGMFNVPDQSKSLPGILSAADTVTTMDRAIGAVPSYVVGPASRACGGCHRAEWIKEDKPGELASFNQHTNAGGYLIENTDDTVLGNVIYCIMEYLGVEFAEIQP
jgi:hypothetical protein